MKGKTKKGQPVEVHSYSAASDTFQVEFLDRQVEVVARIGSDGFSFTIQGHAVLAPLPTEFLHRLESWRKEGRAEARQAGYFEVRKEKVFADQPIEVEKVAWVGDVPHRIERPSSGHYHGKPIEELLRIETGEKISYFEALQIAQAEQGRLDKLETENSDRLEAQDRVLRFIDEEVD